MKRAESVPAEAPEDKKPRIEMSDTPAQERQENFASVGDQAQGIDSSVNDTGASDAQGHPVQEVESLCMNCHENGTTRMLLTKIPFFREIIIMSFECPHCGLKNSEIQPAAQIAEKGSRYIFKIENKEDFNRQVVKSETATCMFTELELEIPPERGQLTNIEGLLSEMVQNLSVDQPARKEAQPEVYEKLNAFIEKVKSCLNGDEGSLPLTFYVDDPAGNSWVEFTPGQPSHKWSMYEYNRTAEQNVFLGLISADDVAQQKKIESEQKKAATNSNVSSSLNNDNPKSSGFSQNDNNDIENLSSEVQTFHATCSACFQPCETNMKSVDIPHFKEVIIMSTFCEHCGYKSNEVKTGGAIPDKGRKISLKITDPDDLARDILKSETCGLRIPELNLDLTPGTLGGRFTTIEGLLTQVYEELHSRVFTQTSDSMDEETKQRWTAFFAKLQDASDGKIGFTVVMEDPLAASYVQNVYAPDNDPHMTIEDYDRTAEQNEDLGLNDMKTD
ncbi:hypothetical protein OY671_001069 [Metschnikowia pulcherrima]|nr:hypothetical protein OY671_001069 [Metschnikowia pulcherrima]